MQITLKGNPINLDGEFPAVGQQAPDFTLTTAALGDVSLDEYAGKKKVISIVNAINHAQPRLCQTLRSANGRRTTSWLNGARSIGVRRR